MAKNISDTIELLTGTKPSDKELLEITKMAKVLDVEEDDIFLKFLAIQYHQNGLMNDLPQKILKSCSNFNDKVKRNAIEIANNEIKKFISEANLKLSNSVEEATKKTLNKVGLLYIWKTILIISIITAIIVAGSCLYCFNYGKNKGIEEGIMQARNEELYLKKRDAFVETRFFNDLFKLYEIGELQDILYCQKRGWEKDEKKGICYPGTFNDGGTTYRYGWILLQH